MTDEEIERALENCWHENTADCGCCPYSERDCYFSLHHDVTAYIKRLKAEKERVRKKTAKEILNTLYRYPHEYHEEKIKDLANKYGVEIEE